ncbi:MAG: DUF4199 domain-containing protein [Bacteroidales bacterium]|nr:DUF4199 domain-containing protein [Bacteroidales bacterium]
MKENTAERTSVWNEAARSGLVLGLVSIAYMVCNAMMGKIQASGVGAALLNVSGILLWVFKFYLCIRLMKLFMQKFAAGNESVTNRDTFSFGTATALLSALIYSGFTLAWMLFIQPDMMTESLDAAVQMYENVFTQDQLDAMREMAPKMPTIAFFVNLVWCWLFGTVLAAVFSRNIPSRNPFEETDNQ